MSAAGRGSGSTSSPQAGNLGGSGQNQGPANPQAGNGAGGAGSPQAGNPGSGTPTPPVLTPEDYAEALRKERLANADARVKLQRLAELEAYRQTAEDAKLSEGERYQKQLAELQAANKAAAAENQMHRLRWAALQIGAELGLDSPKKVDAALRLMDTSAVEWNDDGTPHDLATVLKATIAEYTFLAERGEGGGLGRRGSSSGAGGSTFGGGQQRPAAHSGGATNPGANAGARRFTREQIRKMTVTEYQQHEAEINEAMKAGLVT